MIQADLEATPLESGPAPLHPMVPRIGAAAAVGASAIGALVLLGWATGSEVLRGRLAGDMIVMLPNTAVGVVAAAGAAWLLRSGSQGSRVGRLIALLCSIFVLFLGVATLAERTTGLVLGIDLLLFRDALLSYPYVPPGQMAINSTVCFSLAGAALLFLWREPRVGPLGRELAAGAGLLVSGLALVGYLYGVSPLYAFDRAAGMALLAALAFAHLHVALLFARPATGVVGLITARDLTGAVSRPLLAAGLVIPVASGWLWLRAREAELFSRAGGLALLTLANLLMLLAVTLVTAREIRRVDRRREGLLGRERELRGAAEEARADAEAANGVKTEFLATMSHELRTPLNAIIGYSSLMQEQVTGTLSEEQRRHVGRIKVSAVHLLSLIDQVLALARVDSGSLEVAMGPADTHRLADEAGAIVAPLFAGRPIQFIVQVDRGGHLVTDADRVRQVLINLLSNAAKFTAEGEVRLTVGVDERRGVARFVVADTGIGIAPENHERIFDPFWQVDRSHTRAFEGVGLGLSVSRELARRLGGDLTVTSRLGGGSAFCLELPLGPTDQSEPSRDGLRVGTTAPAPPASPIPPLTDVYSDAPPSR